jgi:hypothetical protein
MDGKSIFGRFRDATQSLTSSVPGISRKPAVPNVLEDLKASESTAKKIRQSAKKLAREPETAEAQRKRLEAETIHRHNISNLPPLVEKLQKFILYETKARFYLVASNAEQTRFRILKISRMLPHELDISEDPSVYTRAQLLELLTMIQAANQGHGGLTKCVSAYGDPLTLCAPHRTQSLARTRAMASVVLTWRALLSCLLRYFGVRSFSSRILHPFYHPHQQGWRFRRARHSYHRRHDNDCYSSSLCDRESKQRP